MRVIAKNNEHKYDLRTHLARSRGAHSVGHRRGVESPSLKRGYYVSSSDWSVHRSRRMGRWSFYGLTLRQKLFTPWHRSFGGAYGISGRVWPRNDVKNLARHEMKQFLIEQIPVLFFIAAFFFMLALG